MSLRIQPLHVADVEVDGETWPVLAWLIHGQDVGQRIGQDRAILVDTGMTESTPELDEQWHPTIHGQAWPGVGQVDVVVNTHLHFDHCGGNRRFAGTPTYVQRAEYEAARAPDYLEEWVRFPGATYELLDGDAEIAPGVSVLSTPGHSPGHQAVVVETDDGLVVLAGDVTYSMRELIAGGQPSIDRIHALRPHEVWLSHHAQPWLPGVR